MADIIHEDGGSFRVNDPERGLLGGPVRYALLDLMGYPFVLDMYGRRDADVIPMNPETIVGAALYRAMTGRDIGTGLQARLIEIFGLPDSDDTELFNLLALYIHTRIDEIQRQGYSSEGIRALARAAESRYNAEVPEDVRALYAAIFDTDEASIAGQGTTISRFQGDDGDLVFLHTRSADGTCHTELRYLIRIRKPQAITD